MLKIKLKANLNITTKIAKTLHNPYSQSQNPTIPSFRINYSHSLGLIKLSLQIVNGALQTDDLLLELIYIQIHLSFAQSPTHSPPNLILPLAGGMQAKNLLLFSICIFSLNI